MITDLVQPSRFWNVNRLNPSFLFKKEQVNIIQIWYAFALTYFIISTSDNNECLAEWQVFHSVTCSTARWITRNEHLLPFNAHNFVCLRMQLAGHQFHLVAQITVFFASTKNVDTLNNSFLLYNWLVVLTTVTLSALAYTSWNCMHYCTGLSLDNQVIRILLTGVNLPSMVLKVQAKNFRTESVILKRAAIHNHCISYNLYRVNKIKCFKLTYP